MGKVPAVKTPTPRESRSRLLNKSSHSADGSVHKRNIKLISPVETITRSRTSSQRKLVLQKRIYEKKTAKYSPKGELDVKVGPGRKKKNLQAAMEKNHNPTVNGTDGLNTNTSEMSTSNGDAPPVDFSQFSEASSSDEFKGFDQNSAPVTEATGKDTGDKNSVSESSGAIAETVSKDPVVNDRETVDNGSEAVDNARKSIDNDSDILKNESEAFNDSEAVDEETRVTETYVKDSEFEEGEKIEEKDHSQEYVVSESTQTSAITDGFKNGDNFSFTFKTPESVPIAIGDDSSVEDEEEDKISCPERKRFINTSELLHEPYGEYLKYVSPRPPLRDYQPNPFEDFYREKIAYIQSSRSDRSSGERSTRSSDILVEPSTSTRDLLVEPSTIRDPDDVTVLQQPKKRVFQSYLDETERNGDGYWKKPRSDNKRTCLIM